MNNVQPPTGRKRSALLPLLLLALALGAAALLWFTRPGSTPEGNLSNAAISGQFDLVDSSGRPVTSASFDGKWRLMYFGYTYCPDVCPMDLATMAAALRLFDERHPDEAKKLQALFVTIDPERDTPEVMAEYTASFHPGILGLTGSRAEVDAALKNFRIYAAKVPGETDDSYTYDHSALFYLLDPKGRAVEFLASQTAAPEQLANTLERFLG